MAEGVGQVRVFVSSPGDAQFERGRLERVIERLNGEFQGVARLAAIRWETEFYKAHATFQAQIPEAAQCDIVVAIFRARLGTELPPDFPHMPDGKPYPSGTAYEVLSAIAAAKDHGLPDVYVFRYPQPPTVQLDNPNRADIEAQWTRVKAFFEAWFQSAEGQFKAAFQTFNSTDDFEAQAEGLLRKWLDDKVLHGRSVVWPVDIKGSPFRGLAAFGARHAPVFFGRSRDITKAADRLKDAAEKGCPFLLVDGASGSGKSSLVRAGLVPRLTAAGVVPSVDLWRVAIVRPQGKGGDPFAALAAALFVNNDDLSEDERGGPSALPELNASDFPLPQDLAAQLSHADESALRPIAGALAAIARAAREASGYEREVNASLLLVVDQFDEFFGGGLTADVRTGFARLLALLARNAHVWIIVTLRADLYDQFLAQPDLKQLKDDGASYDLAPPDAAELAEIVRGPALAADLIYEVDDATGERLDERLLADAGRPDLLPLLQFTLNHLFDAAKVSGHPGVLSFAAYRALGGLEGAVDKEAESALKTLGDGERARLSRLLRQLAVPARDAGITAARAAFDVRSVPVSEAAYDESSAKLVRALVDARILLSSGEGKEATVRLAHARVLDSWQRARAIVTENADFYRIRSDVEEQRRKWEEAKRSRDLLIGRGRPLAEAESIVRRFPEEIPGTTRDFIKRSGRRARLAQTVTAAVALLFAVVAVAAIFAERQATRAQREAEDQRRRAEESRADVSQVATLAREELSYAVSRWEDSLGDTLSWAPPAWSIYLHRQRAFARMDAQNLTSARIDADLAKKADPAYLRLLITSSGLDVTSGDAEGAVRDARAYLQVDKTDPSAYENLILGEGMLGNYREAIQAIDEAQENCHQPFDSVDIALAPDLQELTHRFRISVRDSDNVLALLYTKVFLFAMSGDERFTPALATANRSDRDYPYSRDAYLAALNWAWYIVRGQGPRKVQSTESGEGLPAVTQELTDYGAYAGEGAIWDLVAKTRPDYRDWALRAYQKFLSAYRAHPQDRYKAIADWVERQLASTSTTVPADPSAANRARELAQQAQELRGSSASDAIKYAPAHERLSEAINLLAVKQGSGLGRREQDLLIDLLLRRADWRLDAEDKGGAAEDARRVIALDDKVADAYRVLAASAFDDATRKANDEHTLDLNPYNSTALQDLADLVQANDPAQALALLQKRRRITIFWPTNYLQLSRLQLRLKKYKEALGSIENAIEGAPWQINLYDMRREIETAANVGQDQIVLHMAQGLHARAAYDARTGVDDLALQSYLRAFMLLSSLQNIDGDASFELQRIVRELSAFLSSGYPEERAEGFWRTLAQDPLLTPSQRVLATAEADRLSPQH
jgi:hypothetical protein